MTMAKWLPGVSLIQWLTNYNNLKLPLRFILGLHYLVKVPLTKHNYIRMQKCKSHLAFHKKKVHTLTHVRKIRST